MESGEGAFLGEDERRREAGSYRIDRYIREALEQVMASRLYTYRVS